MKTTRYNSVTRSVKQDQVTTSTVQLNVSPFTSTTDYIATTTL